MKITSKKQLLTAFDRLFDRASNKLALDCTEEDRAEARRSFVNRFEYALEALDEIDLPAIPESAIRGMEESIDDLSPAQVAGYLATGPLVLQVQKLIKTLVARAADRLADMNLRASLIDSM